VTPRHRSARRRRRPSRRRRCRSPIACTFSVDLDANVTPALARPQHLSHPVVLLPVQASPAAVAVAAHRSTTTPRSSWGGGDGDLDHAGVRPAAERRRRTAPSSGGRRLRPTSELPADSPSRLHLRKHAVHERALCIGRSVWRRWRAPSTPVPAGALEGVTCRCGCGRWWRCGRSRAAVPCARRSQNPMTALVVRR
jgi:hypothetical protein